MNVMGLICSARNNNECATEEQPPPDTDLTEQANNSHVILCNEETQVGVKVIPETCGEFPGKESTSEVQVPFSDYCNKLDDFEGRFIRNKRKITLTPEVNRKTAGRMTAWHGGNDSVSYSSMTSMSSIPNPVTPFKRFFSRANSKSRGSSPVKVQHNNNSHNNHEIIIDDHHVACSTPSSTPRHKKNRRRNDHHSLHPHSHLPTSGRRGSLNTSGNNKLSVSPTFASDANSADNDVLDGWKHMDWGSQFVCHPKLVRSSSCQTIATDVATSNDMHPHNSGKEFF